jgi:glycerophosphoryl diester phosphodiesterase
MNDSLSVLTLARSVWRDFLRARYGLFFYEVLFKFLEGWLLGPAVVVLLAAILSQAGHIAISNGDILDFLLTGWGTAYAALFSAVAVALLLFEQTGIMVLVALTGSVKRLALTQMLRIVVRKSHRIVQLAVIQVVLLALALAPLVLLGVLTYYLLLSEYDIYFYWKERPPVFWLAASIGGLLALAALAIGVFLYVGWAFALPILLFENRGPWGALRVSWGRVRGVGRRVGFILMGWLLGMLLLEAGAEAGFRRFAAAILEDAGERPIALMLVLLLAKAGLLATVTFFLVVGIGLITRRLYLMRNGQLRLLPSDGCEQIADTGQPLSKWNKRLAWLSCLLFLLPPVMLWITLSRYRTERPPVLVTAHRGHARAAPENTLSAMRKAIESGADYAEMDVQLTADGVIVLLHDRDLKRVAGDSRRLADLSYHELRTLDVGSLFDPAFAGERVPTLAEVLDLCQGKIRLNIELKFFDTDRRLAHAVADLLRERHCESDCLVTSLNYEGLVEAKQSNSRLRTGLTVAHALGDVSRLEVEAISVRSDFLSDELLRAAHRRGREVHVWTVNEARQMSQLMKRGVDNLITSDPDLALRVRDELANLTDSERLVLASRLLLGLGP